MPDIFVYGTLIFPELVHALTGKTFKTKSAELAGYERLKIYDGDLAREYPALVESSAGKVEGLVLLDIDEESLALLDFFEDEEYERCLVDVTIDGEVRAVFAYVYELQDETIFKDEWNPDEFKHVHLDEYLTEVIPEVRREFYDMLWC